MIRIRNEEEKDYHIVEEITRKAFYKKRRKSTMTGWRKWRKGSSQARKSFIS